MSLHKISQNGQTLVALLIFMMLTIAITTTAAAITIINTQGNSSFTTGQSALANAQTGVENALLRLERDPSYAGETMTLSGGSSVINVSGSSTKIITAVGTAGAYKRTIVATATYSANIITLTSWSETP